MLFCLSIIYRLGAEFCRFLHFCLYNILVCDKIYTYEKKEHNMDLKQLVAAECNFPEEINFVADNLQLTPNLDMD